MFSDDVKARDIKKWINHSLDLLLTCSGNGVGKDTIERLQVVLVNTSRLVFLFLRQQSKS
jgi:hypothetical protein